MRQELYMERIDELREFALKEMNNNILPFWSREVIDSINGGFTGAIDQDGNAMAGSPKGLIMNARILWTFSAVYNFNREPEYLELATRAYNFIEDYFADHEYGGYYWKVDATGGAPDTKKQTYAQAFVIYAFSEYFKACGSEEVLQNAQRLFEVVEKHCVDRVYGGYFEAFSREWQFIEDNRLSDKDMNEKKTMNTHLHVLEAYTSLLQVWENDAVREQLRELIEIFAGKIADSENFHLKLFFDEKWQSKSGMISYGHDIESAWLINEAAMVLGDNALLRRSEELCCSMAEAVVPGINGEGGLAHEVDSDGSGDGELEWWAQAEAVVGFLNAFRISGNSEFLDIAVGVKRFTEKYFIDHSNGEWFYRLDKNGTPLPGFDKAGFWKCPYHNIRMCLEILKFNMSGLPASDK